MEKGRNYRVPFATGVRVTSAVTQVAVVITDNADILTVACLTLHHYSYDLTDIPTLMICSGTYVGYVVVLSGEIIGEVVSAAADAYIDAWWSASGSALFATCGGLTLHNWRDIPECPRRKLAQAAAICALVNSSLFIIDALVAICSARKDEGSTVTRINNKTPKT